VRKIILAFALASTGPCLFLLHIAAAPVHAAGQQSAGAQLTGGPESEIVHGTLTIIRWTTTNPGATDLHYGVVHYGTDPWHLSQVAKSPNRRNPAHPEMVFRVRIAGLQPQTTYYYTVESTKSTGENDGTISPVKTFKTM
jgi:phosphodiesterase/alkaline phosphatase D-like protein